MILGDLLEDILQLTQALFNKAAASASLHSSCLSAGCSTAFPKQALRRAEGDATETQKLIAGKEDGNKSSRKANVENAVLVYV